MIFRPAMFKPVLTIAFFLISFHHCWAKEDRCADALEHSQSICNYIEDFESRRNCVIRNMVGFNYTYPAEYFLNSEKNFVCADIDALNFQAWLLATYPDSGIRNGRLALKMAEEAIKIKDGPNHRDTLAAALAEVGRFEDAVREQTRAIQMLGSKNNANRLADFENRLNYYRQRKPYRQAR